MVPANGEDFVYKQEKNDSMLGHTRAHANGRATKKALLYARVSTDEQARSGYSLA
jgi:hypothetical protein